MRKYLVLMIASKSTHSLRAFSVLKKGKQVAANQSYVQVQENKKVSCWLQFFFLFATETSERQVKKKLTKVETRTFNISHEFNVSQYVEFFLKFEVPEDKIAALEADPERHIFQVTLNHMHSPDIFCFRSMSKVPKLKRSILSTSQSDNSGENL